MLSDLLYRLRTVLRRERADGELDAELSFHFEQQIEKNLRAGMTRENAIRQTKRAFGGVAQIKEDCRRARGTAFIETLLQDVGYGARLLVRNPGFSVTALLTLTLGIGATTAVFSLVDAVLLRPLPYRDSQRIVEIYEDHSGGALGLKYDDDTPGAYADLKRQNQIFADVAAVASGHHVSLLGDGGEPRSLTQESITWNLLPMLGVQPLSGRLFTQEEDSPGHELVVLLSFHLWQDRFGADKQILGRDIRLDSHGSVERYTVIGIMPPRFSFPEDNSDIWIPRALSQKEFNVHDSHELQVLARLRDGITLSRANSDLKTLADQARQFYPSEKSLRSFFALSLRDSYTGDARRGLLLLMTAVAFILIISCANLANLLLSRSIVRRRELGVRAALGASGARLIRQLLTESALMGICGGMAGVAAAWTSFTFLKRLIPAELSSTISLSLNFEVLAFAVLVSLTSSFLFGLAPALQLSGSDLNRSLREANRGNAGPRQNKFGNILVASEMALSVLLLVGGGLLLKSFLRLQSVNPGFRSDHVLVMGRFRKSYSPADAKDFSELMRLFDRMLENVRALPGVTHAGFTSELPLGWVGGRTSFTPEGAVLNPSLYRANDRVITTGYLEALHVPLVRGRLFNQNDVMSSPPAVIINQTMARTFWPEHDPLGKHLKYGGAESPSPWAEIVGIVGDLHQWNLEVPPGPQMYFPHWQAQGHVGLFQLAVETAGDPAALTGALRHAIQSVDPEQPADNIYPLERRIDSNVAPRRLQAALIGSLAMVGLVIATVGIYGVMAYLVAQRTQEMGIRMALGAQRGDVVMLILSRGTKIAGVGVTMGTIAAALFMRLIQSLLFEVRASDPSILAGVGALLLMIALAASAIPARRAASVDPARALRAE